MAFAILRNTLDLENIKFNTIFVVRTVCNFITDKIHTYANKAYPFGTSLTSCGLFAKHQTGYAFFVYIHITNFSDLMRTVSKNLTQQAKGLRGSTPNTRKSVQSVKSYTLKINQLIKEQNQLKQDFEIEKRAKNEAYSFILAHGLLDRFKAYCPSELDTLTERLKLLAKSISVK